ncbi:unnamed protein product [Brachionus calyciflorus]|uniref:FLYWCH-type domain-containing protein n=1 Tax=Brachionus calyciflorus TaxID=104777 RepID=A0A814LB69_9BILA|nr:unnamed protein product [Brachionus calyciflorus]
MSETTVKFLKSNYALNVLNSSHPIAVHNGHKYRWKANNKQTTRYVCTDSTCYASLTLNGDQVIKSRGKHMHETITDSQLLILEATQDLTSEFLENNSKSLSQCFKDFEGKLIEHGIEERIIAAKVTTFKRICPALTKIRSKNETKEPTDYSKLDIIGEYAVTVKNEPFMRYDNKSANARIILIR